MKIIKFFSVACCSLVLMSCNGGGSQQPMVPVNQQQVQVQPQQQAVPDSVMAQQPQTAPAVQPQALPVAVTTFLNKYFPGTSVVGIDTDSEYGGLEYDVYLNDGTEVDFDRNNQWESVDCKVKAVPAAIVPAAIASYVKANYQSLPITKISNKRYGYDVEVSNGLELKFNANGQFVGIDD